MMPLIRELLQCNHGDPDRRRAGAGKWVTVNVPAELWGKIRAAADAVSAVEYTPSDLEALADELAAPHAAAGGVPYDRIPTLVRAAHTAGRMSMRAEAAAIADRIREVKP